MSVSPNGTESPTTVAWGYDAEYLYLAIQCPKTSGSIPPLAVDRAHDANLQQLDRVEITLDVDRDYASSFVFEISENGECSESALGLRSWNPQWFIAADQSHDQWTLEVAIPFSQFGRATAMDREAWAVAIQRCLPGEESPFKASSFLDEPKVESILMFVE